MPKMAATPIRWSVVTGSSNTKYDMATAKVREYLPYDLQFDKVEVDGLKGMVQQHFMVDTSASDYLRNFNIAVDKARADIMRVDLLPTLDPDTYPNLRKIVFWDATIGKSPDLRINNVLWEEEFSTRSFNINNIKGAIRSGSKQADHVIITLSEEINEQTLTRILNARWKDHENLKEIIFRFNNHEWGYKRP